VLVRSELIRCASVPGLQIHGYPEAVNTLRRPPVARGACHGPRELDHLRRAQVNAIPHKRRCGEHFTAEFVLRHDGELCGVRLDDEGGAIFTREEEAVDMRTAHLRFDIDLLAGRLVDAVAWLSEQDATRDLRVGMFGASTGGGAALVAAARVPDRVAAVVSRGGRPDLAGPALPKVTAPTLLIVGGDDVPVIGMNREAYDRLTCERRMEIVPGAGHLFEEPGTLERVAELARDWFTRYLR